MRSSLAKCSNRLHNALKKQSVPMNFLLSDKTILPNVITQQLTREYNSRSNILMNESALPKVEKPLAEIPLEGKTDLEIKDPSLIFARVIKHLEDKFGRKRLYFPKEIYWLVGAPGA